LLESITDTYYDLPVARTVVSTKFQVVISLVPERPLSELKGFARNARSTGFREKRDRL
jgi:hypothetical protein